jgi:hypothetical protein
LEKSVNRKEAIRQEMKATKREILAAMVKLAKKLGHAPSHDELARSINVTRFRVRKLFGSHIRALRECKLDGRASKRKVDMKTLFLDWATVARKVKRIPSSVEYTRLGNYAKGTLCARFGSWDKVAPGLKLYMERHGKAEKWKDVLEMINEQEVEREATGYNEKDARGSSGPMKEAKPIPGRPLYGAPMKPCAMAYCPTNEAGVIYLFGSVAVDLGFMVTSLQAAFPDCEAMRRVEGGKCQPVRIEFEQESRNFLKHMHDVKGADLIVCWEHNWPECPLEVLELRAIVGHEKILPQITQMSADKTNTLKHGGNEGSEGKPYPLKDSDREIGKIENQTIETRSKRRKRRKESRGAKSKS